MEKRGNAMYVFKNAFKNISIFKTRNILMFIIIFMMSFLCCLSLIVWQGAKKYEKSNTALMNISVDFGDDAYRSNVNTAAVFYEGMGTSISFKILLDQNAQTLDELHRFIDVDDRVVSYDIVNTQLTGSENFKSYALDSNMLYFPLTKSKTVTAFSDRQYVSIVGHDPKVSLGRTDQNRFFRIEKGEMFDDTSSEYECIIDRQLAEERNLEVGDKIDVYLNDLEYQLRVTGIYNSFYIETYIDNLAEQKNSVKDIKPNLVDQPNFSSIIYLPSIYVNTPFYEEIRMKRSVGLDMNFNVMGLSSDVVMTDFIQGNKTITYGKVFDPSSDAYECLISEDLARKNGVKVGDEIILRGYIEGSTDITRTFAFGNLTQEMKEDFTTVLQCNMHLAGAVFLEGTTGYNLDVLARMPAWKRGKNFNHGTGHGVGYLMNIHEAPCGFRCAIRDREKQPLMPGLVITDEPGIYIEGSHGVRTENELVVRKGEKNEYGQFLYFEPITYVPIDLDAVIPEMLSAEDKEQLNAYHAKVYEIVAPHLNEEEREWLKEYTRAI